MFVRDLLETKEPVYNYNYMFQENDLNNIINTMIYTYIDKFNLLLAEV